MQARSDTPGKQYRMWLATAVCVALCACAGVEKNPNVVSTYSDKLSPFNYKEDGALVMMVVGVGAARYIRDESYFPVFVQVVNKTRTTFDVTRESFVLEDSLGRQYTMAPSREIMEKYLRMDLDRRAFRTNRSVTSTYVSIYRRIASEFFPSTTGRLLIVDRVTLPGKTYMEDILYFPIPETGLFNVTQRLLFRVKALEEPIQVVFEVPKTFGVFEHEDEE